jgi:hypothetical protein
MYDKKALELLDIDVIDGEIITFKKIEPKRTFRTINSNRIKESSTVDLNTDLNSMKRN